MSKSAVIAGAGVSGVSAGSYLQMNGYDTEIFELHNTPGGLCTAWKRSEHTFDGCIAAIGGLNPKFKLYHYWNELIDLKKLKCIELWHSSFQPSHQYKRSMDEDRECSERSNSDHYSR